MKIAGLAKTSFVDYPRFISAVIFTQGCNYDCFFCHNRDLIPFNEQTINEDEIFTFLKKRIGLIDGVVLSGGEPTAQRGLVEFSQKIKELGFLLKLDTNGSNPSVVKDLIKAKLLDYVAIDYKAPFDKYDAICCVKCDTDAVKETIKLVIDSGISYELRTTFLPQFNSNDIKNMLNEIPKIERYSLQRYKEPENYRREQSALIASNPSSELEIKKAVEIAKEYVKNINLR